MTEIELSAALMALLKGELSAAQPMTEGFLPNFVL